MPFEMTRSSSGRSGEILYLEGARSIRIYWEMSGSPQFDVLLAPLNLSRWLPDFSQVPRVKQLQILSHLRHWLADQGLRSDLVAPSSATRGGACAWLACKAKPLLHSAYCPAHFDETLLVPEG